MDNLTTLCSIAEALSAFTDDYTELKDSLTACTEKARDKVEELSELLDDLYSFLENLPL